MALLEGSLKVTGFVEAAEFRGLREESVLTGDGAAAGSASGTGSVRALCVLRCTTAPDAVCTRRTAPPANRK